MGHLSHGVNLDRNDASIGCHQSWIDYPEGALGEAVRSALATSGVPVLCLAVRKKPMSGKPGELLDYEEISSKALVAKVRSLNIR
jgi:hypothetical protein